MALTAVWVGGCVARPMRVGPGSLEKVSGIDWTDINGDPLGSHITFRGVGGTTNWFHFPIPTPVILNDKRANLKKVFVFYRADTNVEFEKFFLCDGPIGIAPLQSVSLVGPVNFVDSIKMGQNAWDVIPSVSMKWGLTITVIIKFISSGNIVFTTAGADFEV
jgi:hypothetical protein